MSIIVEHSATMASDPKTVWGLLMNTASWSTWWKECEVAQTTDRKTLREGSKIELLLLPGSRKITLWPVVDMLTEGKTFSLTHRSTLYQGTVVWRIVPAKDGIRVDVRGVFQGVGITMLKMTGGTSTIQSTLRSNLRGLKRLAEQMI